MSETPKRILFVCMGNICRSPTAEAIFRKLVRRNGLQDRIECDSAGTIGYHAGEPADGRMRAAAAERGYDLDSIARPVRAEDFDRFDLLVGMDPENLAHLNGMARDEQDRGRIRAIVNYARQHNEPEVPDPYYGGAKGFQRVLDLLEDACEGLLEEVRGGNKEAPRG